MRRKTAIGNSMSYSGRNSLGDFSKVSIIIVVKNDAKHIAETLDNIIAQDYPNKEIIVIDGKSEDGTREIIESKGNLVDKLVSEEDGGIFDAMNKGISLSSGDWICFINSGDGFYESTSISKISSNWDKHSEIILGDTRIVDRNRKEVEIYRANLSKVHLNTPAFHQSQFIKARLLKGMPYDLTYRYVSDYDFLLKCLRSKVEFQTLNFVTTYYLQGGISSFMTGMAMLEAISILIKNEVNLPDICKSHWFVNLARTSHEVNANYSFSHSYNKLLKQIDFISNNYSKIILYGDGKLASLLHTSLGNKITKIISNLHVEDKALAFQEFLDGETCAYDSIIISVLGREDEISYLLQRRFLIDDKKIFIFDL